jgi:hypothetical protein
MNIVCVGLGIVSVVSIGLLIFMVNTFNKACEKWHKAEEQVEAKRDKVVDLLIERHELKHQLEEAEKRYADLLEEQYDNVVSIYKNR